MANDNRPLETLLTERQVAELLRVSVATIRRRRLLRLPPAHLKIGASVRYRRETIQRFIEDAARCTDVQP